MKEIMNLKFKRSIQLKLNKLFFDEEYHAYTLGELLKIIAANILFIAFIILTSFAN